LNEVAEAALDAVCRCLLNVPGGVLSVQPAVDAHAERRLLAFEAEEASGGLRSPSVLLRTRK
jgi:hypothetical protein